MALSAVAGAILGAGLSAGGGLLGSLINKNTSDRAMDKEKEIANATNQANKEIAQMNIDYQNAYNQQIWDREDTSYQRTVEDMQKAGLSPLSMGSTNGAGGTTSAPQSNQQVQGYMVHEADMSTPLTSGINNAIANALQLKSMDLQVKMQEEELKQKQAQFDVSTANAIDQFDKTMKFNEEQREIDRNKLSNQYSDIKNLVGALKQDFFDVTGGKSAKELYDSGKDKLQDTIDNVIKEYGIPLKTSAEREADALKKESDRVAKYRKQQQEKKAKEQAKAFNEYKKNYYNDSALNESYIANSINY